MKANPKRCCSSYIVVKGLMVQVYTTYRSRHAFQVIESLQGPLIRLYFQDNEGVWTETAFFHVTTAQELIDCMVRAQEICNVQ